MVEKKKKSSSNKNFDKKERSIYDLYTFISRWISNFKKRNTTLLIEEIKKYNLNQYEIISVVKKVSFYGLKYPKFIWYINKYFNNTYEFNKYESSLLIYNIIFLLTQFVDDGNPKYFNKLVIFKSNYKKDLNYINITKVIYRYFDEIYNIQFNDLELKYYYILYENRIIRETDIYDMNLKLSEPIKGLKLELENIEFDKLPEKKPDNNEIKAETNTSVEVKKLPKVKKETHAEKQKTDKVSFASKKKKIISEFKIKPENIITEVNDKLTLLDIASIDDLIIIEIYVDETGIKKYLIKDYIQPIYFKSGSNWKENTMTSDSVDNVVMISGISKKKASRLIYNNLAELKNRVL